MALGVGLLALSLPAALLLAAALAPTDPVLASDVQIEQPKSDYDDEARFALTKEAGLNDALAFPFVHLAIAASLSGWGAGMWGAWALDAVLIRLSVGLLVGIVAGRLLGWIIYRLPSHSRLARTGAGFVALGATLAVYAAAELAHGYGFLSVFVAGLVLRRAARDHGYNERMHDFADESERLLMLLLLILFGGMLAAEDIFALLSSGHLLFAAAMLLLVRPAAALISMVGVQRPMLEKGIIAFFGIRGLGSVYYLAYGLNHADFGGAESMWAVLALVILASILLHGILVTPAMRRLDHMHHDGSSSR
jgi:sodium/hydrogen antiporter